MKQLARLRIATPYTTQRVYSIVTYRWPDGRGYASFGLTGWPVEPLDAAARRAAEFAGRLLAAGGVLLAAEGAS